MNTEHQYPNREHEAEDKAALRRALKNLERITDSVTIIDRRLRGGGGAARAEAADARGMLTQVGELLENLQKLETLRDVREWHAADQAETPLLTDGHTHEHGLHAGWLGHNGHLIHRHSADGRTEWNRAEWGKR